MCYRPPHGGKAAAIEVRDIRKVFQLRRGQPVVALEHVNLAVGDNEFFTLLGPSGCGKTTLLRLLAGFEAPTEGDILLFNEHLENLPPHKRPINTVFQHYALFPHMSVYENVAFGLEMLGYDKSELKRTALQALELVQMEGFATRKPAQLSGGQQQRVALARALAPRPKVLLLDEPLSALDLKLRQAMRLELKTLQRETGVTFIFVTHDQEEALTMSDRIAVMSAGQVQQVGTPTDIYEKPVNRFVADFVGRTNFLRGTVVDVVDGYTQVALVSGGQVEAQGDAHRAGEQVTLVVRPERIALTSSGRGLPGTVVSSMYLGTDTNYSVQVADGLTLEVRDPNASGSARFGAGDTVCVSIAPGAARALQG